MLSLGLTGGIAAGKSLLTARFRELGAVVIDADQLAREVVAVGTPGLGALVERFGAQMLLPDGSLDRPKLGSLVFADQTARESLNAIVHPLVRAAAHALKLDAGPGSIVVQDIPLLVESGQGATFHLVVVVQAPREERIARMVRDRGMSRDDALARMAAQASDEERAAAADVLILNDGSPEQAVAELDTLWHERLVPFAANIATRRPASDRTESTVSAEMASGAAREAPDVVPTAAQTRLKARIQHAVAELDCEVEPANDGMGLTLRPRLRADETRQHLVQALAGAAFFPCTPSGSSQDLLASADPGQMATVEIKF